MQRNAGNVDCWTGGYVDLILATRLTTIIVVSLLDKLIIATTMAQDQTTIRNRPEMNEIRSGLNSISKSHRLKFVQG